MKNKVLKIVKMMFLSSFLLLVAVVGMALLYFAYCEANKAYWDHNVKQWCERDGGVTIYQKITITTEQAGELGRVAGFIAIAPKVKWRSAVPVYTIDKEIFIKDGWLKVIKNEREVIRSDNGVAIGKIISYGRGGGDAVAIDHPSSFSCPEIPEYYKEQEKFFIINGDNK